MWNFSEIKNVILDLGGVLFEVDYRLTAKAFGLLGMADFEAAYSQANQNNWFDDFETGKIGPSELRSYLRSFLPKTVTDEQIDAAWNAMLIGMPAYKFDTLKRLKPHFKLFLLSNTNGIHLPEVRHMIAQQTPGMRLEDHFIKTYYSHEIKLRKPHPEVFQLVLDEQGLNAAETLFLDDSIQHITGAAGIGIQTELVTKENSTEHIFSPFLS